MDYKITVPKVQHVRLVKEVFMRTNDYLLTKKIMMNSYGVKIKLTPKD